MLILLFIDDVVLQNGNERSRKYDEMQLVFNFNIISFFRKLIGLPKLVYGIIKINNTYAEL